MTLLKHDNTTFIKLNNCSSHSRETMLLAKNLVFICNIIPKSLQYVLIVCTKDGLRSPNTPPIHHIFLSPNLITSISPQIIKKFRDEELEHHDTGLEHGAEMAPQYKLLSKVIKLGCQTAIKVAEKV